MTTAVQHLLNEFDALSEVEKREAATEVLRRTSNAGTGELLVSAEGAFDTEPEILYISPMAFLRSMVVLAWTAFRHPFSTTVIDLSTGKIVPEERTNP